MSSTQTQGSAAAGSAAQPPVRRRLGGVLKEFREFAVRGNVVELAVAVVVGAAFGRITTSLVNDIIMPSIGLLLGSVNFSSLYFSLNGTAYPSLSAAQAVGAPTINYGLFINNILDFFIVAFAMFIVVRMMNRLKSRQPARSTEPSIRPCPYCLSSVPLNATRCSQCTSYLPPAGEDAPATGASGTPPPGFLPPGTPSSGGTVPPPGGMPPSRLDVEQKPKQIGE
jgi:large conductance mechanosensitive channel